ncbi:unnamed protein product [Citrullus colocynthis]|uniref:Uncharacterized protein n=1 Tax=Citrullus colocynthis TaxID=252529 RepID=A0ABP0XLW6_9ROSI
MASWNRDEGEALLMEKLMETRTMYLVEVVVFGVQESMVSRKYCECLSLYVKFENGGVKVSSSKKKKKNEVL